MIARCLVCLALLAGLSLPAVRAGDDEEEHIGGILGTGIVGTITELGSIVVNGQMIEIDAGQAVENPIRQQLAGDLSPGDTVAVTVTLTERGWTARTIARIFPIIGPVSIGQDGQLQVMGTQIDVSDPAHTISLETGDWVAVSGLWLADRIIASRIERVGPQPFAQILGTYLATTADDVLIVGGTIVTGIAIEHVSPGDVVRIRGVLRDGGLDASQIATGVFVDQPGVILAEGYLSAPQPSGLYTLLGTGLVGFTDQPEMIDALVRQTQCGVNRDLVTAIPEPDLAGARATLVKLGCLDG